MKINSINSNPTAFKASFSYRVIPDCDNHGIEKIPISELYLQAKNDDPKGYEGVMNFLDYMKSDEGIKKLTELSPADELDLEIVIKPNRANKGKLKFLPLITYSVGYMGNKDGLKISNYFSSNSQKFGQMGTKNPSRLLNYISDVKEGKIDIQA